MAFYVSDKGYEYNKEESIFTFKFQPSMSLDLNTTKSGQKSRVKQGIWILSSSCCWHREWRYWKMVVDGSEGDISRSNYVNRSPKLQTKTALFLSVPKWIIY